MTCIHAATDLCPACQATYAADPGAYLEYGDHHAGIARWRALQEDIAHDAHDACQPTVIVGDRPSDIPF